MNTFSKMSDILIVLLLSVSGALEITSANDLDNRLAQMELQLADRLGKLESGVSDLKVNKSISAERIAELEDDVNGHQTDIYTLQDAMDSELRKKDYSRMFDEVKSEDGVNNEIGKNDFQNKTDQSKQ
jgi:predicted  nucleic acid-binding Zn-ribbon protein